MREYPKFPRPVSQWSNEHLESDRKLLRKRFLFFRHVLGPFVSLNKRHRNLGFLFYVHISVIWFTREGIKTNWVTAEPISWAKSFWNNCGRPGRTSQAAWLSISQYESLQTWPTAQILQNSKRTMGWFWVQKLRNNRSGGWLNSDYVLSKSVFDRKLCTIWKSSSKTCMDWPISAGKYFRFFN